MSRDIIREGNQEFALGAKCRESGVPFQPLETRGATVVPCIATLIHAAKIAAKRFCRYAILKSP